MSGDLHELLTKTSVTPRRPVDVARIRDGIRRRRRTRQCLFGVSAAVAIVAAVGIAMTVVPKSPEDVVLDSPPPVVASEPPVKQPLLPTAQSETAGDTQRDDDQLTSPEKVLLDAFVAFARKPSDTTAAAVPWAEEVALHLGNQPAQATFAPGNATGPVWSLDAVAYNGYVGPLDARELIAQTTFPLTFGAGRHPHCASPPVPAPAVLAESRRLSIQPDGITTCLDWFTVDLFLNGAVQVEAVSLDLWEP